MIALLLTVTALSSGIALAGEAAADFFVSPGGNDRWSGTLPAPNAAATDGPFATLTRAQQAARGLRAAAPNRPVTVLLRGGVYALTEPIRFLPQDSGAEGAPVTYAAYPGETPVLSCGSEIGGWKKGDGELWVAEIPEVKAGNWYFH